MYSGSVLSVHSGQFTIITMKFTEYSQQHSVFTSPLKNCILSKEARTAQVEGTLPGLHTWDKECYPLILSFKKQLPIRTIVLHFMQCIYLIN